MDILVFYFCKIATLGKYKINFSNAWNILDRHGENDVPEKLVLKIAYYVASALEYMHKK